MMRFTIFKNIHFWFCLLIVFIGIALYANSFSNPFAWDDQALVTDSILIKDFRNFFKLFTTHIGYEVAITNSYRPLSMLTHMLDYHIWRLDPFGYHLTNTILHILVALLVYCLILNLSKNRLISLITSLFFLTHPICVDAVTYISGRADPLVALFLLSSFILFIRYPDYQGSKRISFYWLSVLCFVLALLSKESAIVFPLILITYDLGLRFNRQSVIKDFIIRVMPFVLIDLIYIILRLTVLSFIDFPLPMASVHLYNRILTFIKAIMLYLRILILPFDMHMERIIGVPNSIFRLDAFLSLVGLLAIIILIILSYKRLRLIWFFSVWFFIFLLPQSGLYPINAFISDHFLYLSSIGFFFISTFFLFRILPRKMFFSIVICLLIFFGYFTFKQNKIWSDEELLYKHILKLSPYSWQSRHNLGTYYLNRNMNEEALREYQKSIKIYDGVHIAHYNIGIAYYRMGKYKEAIEKFQEMMQKFPERDSEKVHYMLGLSYMNLKRYNDALKEFNTTLELKGDFFDAYFAIAKIYQKKGKKREAVKTWLSILKMDEELPRLLALRRPRLNEYVKIIKTRQNMMPAILDLGELFGKYELWDLAEQVFKKAISIDPSYLDAYHKLGEMYLNKGDFQEAYRIAKEALNLIPRRYKSSDLGRELLKSD